MIFQSRLARHLIVERTLGEAPFPRLQKVRLVDDFSD
jgi:hypothetical protein